MLFIANPIVTEVNTLYGSIYAVSYTHLTLPTT